MELTTTISSHFTQLSLSNDDLQRGRMLRGARGIREAWSRPTCPVVCSQRVCCRGVTAGHRRNRAKRPRGTSAPSSYGRASGLASFNHIPSIPAHPAPLCARVAHEKSDSPQGHLNLDVLDLKAGGKRLPQLVRLLGIRHAQRVQVLGAPHLPLHTHKVLSVSA